MRRILKVKPILNKRNGQINISLPRKKLPFKILNNLAKISKLRIKLEGWE